MTCTRNSNQSVLVHEPHHVDAYGDQPITGTKGTELPAGQSEILHDIKAILVIPVSESTCPKSTRDNEHFHRHGTTQSPPARGSHGARRAIPGRSPSQNDRG